MFGKRSLILTFAFITAVTVLFLCTSRGWAQEPEIAGAAAVLIDAQNCQVLFEKNSHVRVYPASTTKVLTAVLALEKCRLDETVTVCEEAELVEGSSVGLKGGERLSLEDLLYALLLSSGNDAAVAIACHVAGSVSSFAAMMNEKAREIGARESHFANPSGLPDPAHYSTAYDMALIARYAMQNQIFRKIVSTEQKTIKRDVPDAQTYLLNHNKLLWLYDGANGIKTGYTVEAGQCLLSSAGRRGRELIASVMKSEGANIWSDTEKLLDFGFTAFEPVVLAESGKAAAEIPVKYGVEGVVLARVGSTFSYNFKKGEAPPIRQEVFLKKDITAPLRAGEKVGDLVFYRGEEEIGRTDLVSDREVKRKLFSGPRLWFYLLSCAAVLLAVARYRAKRSLNSRWRKKRSKRRYVF